LNPMELLLFVILGVLSLGLPIVLTIAELLP
jgi:hypothetical protein